MAHFWFIFPLEKQHRPGLASWIVYITLALYSYYMVTIDATLNLLGDATRRRIIELLVSGSRRTSELSDALGVSVPALSRHLKVLRQNRIVVRQDDPEDGRARRYSLMPDVFVDVANWTEQANWAGRLSKTGKTTDVKLMLERAGEFLDAFATGDAQFFERHLAADVGLVFPGSSQVLCRQDVLDSVGHHPDWRRYEVLDSGQTTSLCAATTLFHYKALVQNANEKRHRIVWITMIFRETSEFWNLNWLQWTKASR
ncbi:MAG: ArsR/SmtB family transcription factor [bacterium]